MLQRSALSFSCCVLAALAFADDCPAQSSSVLQHMLQGSKALVEEAAESADAPPQAGGAGNFSLPWWASRTLPSVDT